MNYNERSYSNSHSYLLIDQHQRHHHLGQLISLVPSFEPPSPSTVGSRRRRQHTLDSLSGETSRSRSPIVESCGKTPSFVSLACDTPTPSLTITTVGDMLRRHSTSVSPLEPQERISLQSFERRRSIYERADGTNGFARSDQLDQLSLSAVLADLETKERLDGEGVGLHQEAEQGLELDGPHLVVGGSRRNSSSVTSMGGDSSSPGNSTGNSTGNSNSNNKDDDEQARRHEILHGFEIVWLNFSYSVGPTLLEDPRWGSLNKLFHKEHRTILKGLSGGLKSGQMVALMGPSGAGKTCLLECISGVRTTGIGGQILVRGRRSAQLVIVPQYDNFMPQFTVEEIIIYGSKMKNPRETDHRAVTEKVIQQLGLQVCRSNNIQQCSGGQRKRAAIAQELVSRPNILILDEPTSGLDSSCCYQTMRVLRDVLDESVASEQPMSIVTTIHQPSAKVFKIFDLIYLLGKTGRLAYSGPPRELMATISQVTGLECPTYSNPSDYMIELVSGDYGDEPVDKLIEFERDKAKEFVRQWELKTGARIGPPTPELTNVTTTCLGGATATPPPPPSSPYLTAGLLKPSKSDTHLVGRQQKQSLRSSSSSPPPLYNWKHVDYSLNQSVPLRRATASGSQNRHPFIWHVYVHFHRSFFQSIRDPILNNMRILIHLGFASMLVLLFGKKSGEARGCPPILGLPSEITDPDNESMIDLADNVGYLFMCIMMITYVSLMSTVLTFPIDIKVVGKEYKNGWYGTMTYFVGKSLADLPFIVLYPIFYCLIVWFMTNQGGGGNDSDESWRFYSFTGLIIMNAMNSQSFGLILGALFVNSVTAATFLGPVITIPWYLFTGFTKRIHRLAEPYRTTSKFLFTRYVFEGLLDTVYGHQRCNCSGFLQKYYELRYEEIVRLGQLISAETLSSQDYYDGLDVIAPSYMNRSATSTSNAQNQWFQMAAAGGGGGGDNLDLDLDLANLMATNGKASSLFSFGLDFEPTCPQNYRNFVVQDFRLDENTARNAFLTTLITLAVIRVLTFIVVTWKIRTREL